MHVEARTGKTKPTAPSMINFKEFYGPGFISTMYNYLLPKFQEQSFEP